MSKTIPISLGVVVALTLAMRPTIASANPELPYILDARGIGMGGTAVASADGISGAFYNPAALARTETLDASLTINPYMDKGSSPFLDPTLGETTPVAFDPKGLLGSVGLAFRVHPRVAVGAAFNITSASGGDYEEVALFGGEDASASLLTAESMVPISVRLTDKLDLAVAWRMTYFSGSLKIPSLVDENDPGAGFIVPELSGNKLNFAGVSAGFRYRSDYNIEWGLSYRNKVKQTLSIAPKLDGEVIPNAEPVDINLATPHDVRFGGEWHNRDSRVQLAADVRYWFYEDAYPADPVLRANDGDDSWGVNAGGEYWVTPEIPVRAGALYWASATPEANANAFEVPPGGIVGATLGTGYDLGDVHVDGAFGFYQWIASRGAPMGAELVLPMVLEQRDYDYRSLTFSLSATYRR